MGIQVVCAEFPKISRVIDANSQARDEVCQMDVTAVIHWSQVEFPLRSCQWPSNSSEYPGASVRIRDCGSYSVWRVVFVVSRLSGYIVVRAMPGLAPHDYDSGQTQSMLVV